MTYRPPNADRTLPAYRVGERIGPLEVLDPGDGEKSCTRLVRVRCTRCGAERHRSEKDLLSQAKKRISQTCNGCKGRVAEVIGRENEIVDALRAEPLTRAELDRALGRRYRPNSLMRILLRLVEQGRIVRVRGPRTSLYVLSKE